MYIIGKYRQSYNSNSSGANSPHPAVPNSYTPEHYDLTFAEFVRFLTDIDSANKKDSMHSYIMNRHWMEMYAQCLPCEVHYDYIGKYETLLDDADFILKNAQVDHIVEFPSFSGSSPTNSSHADTLLEYYAKVPWKYINDLLVRFSLDIQMFGYGTSPMNALPSRSQFMRWLKETGS